MEIVEEIHHEVRAGDQHADVHEPGKDQKPLEVRPALPSQERQQAELGFARHGLGRLVDPGEIARGEPAGGRRQQEDYHKTGPRLPPGFSRMEHQTSPAQGEKAGDSHKPSPVTEIRPPLIRVDEVRDQAVPSGDGKVPHRNVGDGAGDQQPRRVFPKHERQREQGEPDHRLPAPRYAPPPPPPPGRFSWGLASFTVILRPFIWVPFSAVIAFWASSAVAISTNPNPRDWPVYRSVMILADVTDPCCENSS